MSLEDLRNLSQIPHNLKQRENINLPKLQNRSTSQVSSDKFLNKSIPILLYIFITFLQSSKYRSCVNAIAIEFKCNIIFTG